MKTYTIIKTTALILALITVSIATAAAISCDCGDICVNEAGWWRDGGEFNASIAPIQAAADNASSGDTICVKDGSYNENVDVATDHLTIQSENGSVSTIVQAANSGDRIFEVTANYVNISGFNVTGATVNVGIYLNGADHCNISDNTASGNWDGIYIDSSSNNTLLNNTASNNDDDGIELWSSSDNTLTGNTANSNCCDGIYIDSSSNNTLLNNTASKNEYYGIDLYDSSDNTLTDNTASHNYEDGIFLWSSSANTLTGNIASNNDGDGIELYDSSDNTLTGNTALYNYDGIYLDSSSNNRLLNNTASNNDNYGINLYDSSDNLIYNNYWSNTDNVCDDRPNQWNTTVTTGQNIIGGPSVGGNYWSDYTGADPDGDGLGNTSYNIVGGSNFDYHPLCPSGASVKGDLDGDGDLTPADASIALQLAASSACDPAADVSNDRQVTSLDALMILQAAAEMVEL